MRGRFEHLIGPLVGMHAGVEERFDARAAVAGRAGDRNGGDVRVRERGWQRVVAQDDGAPRNRRRSPPPRRAAGRAPGRSARVREPLPHASWCLLVQRVLPRRMPAVEGLKC